MYKASDLKAGFCQQRGLDNCLKKSKDFQQCFVFNFVAFIMFHSFTFTFMQTACVRKYMWTLFCCNGGINNWIMLYVMIRVSLIVPPNWGALERMMFVQYLEYESASYMLYFVFVTVVFCLGWCFSNSQYVIGLPPALIIENNSSEWYPLLHLNLWK